MKNLILLFFIFFAWATFNPGNSAYSPRGIVCKTSSGVNTVLIQKDRIKLKDHNQKVVYASNLLNGRVNSPLWHRKVNLSFYDNGRKYSVGIRDYRSPNPIEDYLQIKNESNGYKVLYPLNCKTY